MIDKIEGGLSVILTPEEADLATRQDEAMASGTVSKADARYQNEPHNGETCGGCTMFVEGFPDDKAGFCSKVISYRGPAGFIFEDGWCKYFDGIKWDEIDKIVDAAMAKGAEDQAPKEHELIEALDAALKLDRLRYLAGVKRIMLIGNPDKWNAMYDPDRDTIHIEGKLMAEPTREQVRTILHEAGHHAQFKRDKQTFQGFKRSGLGTEQHFMEIANAVHSEDYLRKGWVDDLAGEVFAESYARFCIGMPLPNILRAFWISRLDAGNESGQ